MTDEASTRSGRRRSPSPVAALILRRLPGIVLGLTLLLLLDRVVGFSPWGVAEADRRFAQLARERRRAGCRAAAPGPAGSTTSMRDPVGRRPPGNSGTTNLGLRAVSALHVARSFAQLGPRIGAGLAGQFRDARGAPVAGTAGDKRAAISENDLGLRHRETCKPIEASKPLNAYRAAVKRAFGRSRRSRGLPTGGRLGGRSPTGHAGRWGRPGSKRRVQLTASTVSPASVAASMSFTTSAGWETIARCPEETSAIVAPMRLANMR